MKTELLFDTNIIIDYLNGISYAQKQVEGCARRALSMISVIEILCGIPEPEEHAVHQWLYQYFHILEVNESVMLEAVKIRRAKKLKLPDTIILATAIACHYTLCTRDAKGFSSYKDVQIISP